MSIDYEDEDIHFNRVLLEDEVKCFQWRIAVSEFRGVQYLNIRKWFLSFEGEWIPSREGATMPLSIEITAKLVIALGDILSNAEKEQLHEVVAEIYKKADINDDIPF